jgi:hypothetical protein
VRIHRSRRDPPQKSMQFNGDRVVSVRLLRDPPVHRMRNLLLVGETNIRKYNESPKPVKWSYSDPIKRIRSIHSPITVH